MECEAGHGDSLYSCPVGHNPSLQILCTHSPGATEEGSWWQGALTASDWPALQPKEEALQGLASATVSLASCCIPTAHFLAPFSPSSRGLAFACWFITRIFSSQCSCPSLSSKGCLMTLDPLLFLCLPMDTGHPWEGYSLPPAALHLVPCPKFCPFFPKWLKAFFFAVEKGWKYLGQNFDPFLKWPPQVFPRPPQ